MKLYNTRTRQKEDFSTYKDNQVNIYSCGPTVYDKLHIGNWSSYIRWDVLVRILDFKRYKVDRVINITDVGHLVSDEDEGEDKLEVGARREGLDAWQIAEKYFEDFKHGVAQLQLIAPSHYARATDNIEEQIDLIKILEQKNYTYTIDDGIYFDTSKFEGYGKFAQLDTIHQLEGARVEVNPSKRNPSDFALWKFSPLGHQRQMEWDSPWGKGFPGWHIECSAMALKFFDSNLDIHTGGIDHIPIHHTNEIAQSEAATGHQFSKYWLHNNFLLVDGVKISKSLGNGYTLDDIMNKGFSLMEFKLFIHQSHYRSEINFSWDNLESAKNRLVGYRAMADMLWQASLTEDVNIPIKDYSLKFIEALENDMDTPSALAFLSDFSDQVMTRGVSAAEIPSFRDFLELVDNLLGLDLSSAEDITNEDKHLILRREEYRNSNNWSEADKIRQKLLGHNIMISDTSHGPVWSRVR